MIKKKFIHFNSFENFATKKLSADMDNRTYRVGLNGEVKTGNPDIMWQSIVLIADTKSIWTHGWHTVMGESDFEEIAATAIVNLNTRVEDINSKVTELNNYINSLSEQTHILNSDKIVFQRNNKLYKISLINFLDSLEGNNYYDSEDNNKLPAEEIAGTIIGKNADGEITYVKYKDFIKDSFDTTTFTPVSVLVIPRSHTKDGKCRGVSLMNMSTETPETGSNVALTMDWGMTTNGTLLTNYGSITTGNVPVGDTLSTYYYAYLPTDKLYTTPSVVDTVGGVAQSYYGTSTPFIPSPYMAEGKPNPQYWEGLDAYEDQVNTDMNGKMNTNNVIMSKIAYSDKSTLLSSGTIQNERSYYPAFTTCYRYQGGGFTDHSWYLPSCGEIGYCIVRCGIINDALDAIRAKYGTSAAALISSGTYYWTSSVQSYNYAYSAKPSSGEVQLQEVFNKQVVRAFRAF